MAGCSIWSRSLIVVIKAAADKLAAITTAISPSHDDWSPLLSLPPELHLRVVKDLDYLEAVRLSQVNKHFHALVDPQQCPVEDKRRFVRDAQYWPKHNRMHLSMVSDDGETLFDTNGHACYSCYRVRPKREFSVRHSTKTLGKTSPRDYEDESGIYGCGRFCVDCGIKSGDYRAGMRLKVVVDERLTPTNREYLCEAETLALCSSCNKFMEEVWDGMNGPATCDECKIEHKVAKDRHSIYQRLRNGRRARFFACPQCEKKTLGCNLRKGRCCFCKREVCQSCGCITNEKGEWWCGRSCSKAAWTFVQKMMREEWPTEVTLRKSIGKLRRARKRRKGVKADVLDCEEVEEALSWLAL
ncbi:hypothetical protein LTR56_017481 [Elasticomyces elasticus]|nr:hypothetical protein LTR56_017481 [Elasticomyces elasticus]KAK3640890.1 hypothetical protein LTR22_016815 [Elasticomyces elasticus]KAK4920307.1 hypothetical protein LTR49_012086 [Elasticomyces elasticus]KAK5759080.1 hypothetical protein LTS12_010855 [Elasticomyces elasticus]